MHDIYEEMLQRKAREYVQFQEDQRLAKAALAVAAAAKQAQAKPPTALASRMPPVVAYRIQQAKFARVKRELVDHQDEIAKRRRATTEEKAAGLEQALSVGTAVVNLEE